MSTTYTRCRTANDAGFLGVTGHCTSYIMGRIKPGPKRTAVIPNRRVTRVTLTHLCALANRGGCLSRTGCLLSCHNGAHVHGPCSRDRTPVLRRGRTMNRTIHTNCVCTNVTSITTLAGSSTCVGIVSHVFRGVINGGCCLANNMNTHRSNRTFNSGCRLPGVATCGRAYTTVSVICLFRHVFLLRNRDGCVSYVRHALCGNIVSNVDVSNNEFFCPGPLSDSNGCGFGTSNGAAHRP